VLRDDAPGGDVAVEDDAGAAGLVGSFAPAGLVGK